MPLRPGPLTLQHPAALDLTPGQYTFTDLTDSSLAEVDAIGAQIDGSVSELMTEAAAPADPSPDFDFASGWQTVDNGTLTAIATIQAGMDACAFRMVVNITAAISYAPAEAWQPAPDPYVPPDNGFNLGMQPDQTAGGPTRGWSSSIYTIPTPPGYTFAILNLTQYGGSQFTETDKRDIRASGPPLADVTVHAWKDAADLGTELLGQTDEYGYFEQTGEFQIGDAGAWIEDWFVGGTLVQHLQFIVLPTTA